MGRVALPRIAKPKAEESSISSDRMLSKESFDCTVKDAITPAVVSVSAGLRVEG